jgi:hypothetical protein
LWVRAALRRKNKDWFHSVEGDLQLVNANSAQTVLYFFLLMLYKTSTCKIFLLCAVVFFHNFYSLKTFFCFSFFLSICKSNIPLTSIHQLQVTFDRMVMILYRTYNSFSLFAMQLNYCNIQRVFDQK